MSQLLHDNAQRTIGSDELKAAEDNELRFLSELRCDILVRPERTIAPRALRAVVPASGSRLTDSERIVGKTEVP